jgi:hypothetical protein
LDYFITDVTDMLEKRKYEIVTGNPECQQVRKKDSPVGFNAVIDAPLEGRTSDLVVVHVKFWYAAPDRDTGRSAFPDDQAVRKEFSDLAYHSKTAGGENDYDPDISTMHQGADIGMRPSAVTGREMRKMAADYINYVCDRVTKALSEKR